MGVQVGQGAAMVAVEAVEGIPLAGPRGAAGMMAKVCVCGQRKGRKIERGGRPQRGSGRGPTPVLGRSGGKERGRLICQPTHTIIHLKPHTSNTHTHTPDLTHTGDRAMKRFFAASVGSRVIVRKVRRRRKEIERVSFIIRAM